MADINPQTTFHVAFSEREFNIVMLALAFMGSAADGNVKPDGRSRQQAAELNLQLLNNAKQAFEGRVHVVETKLARAPRADNADTELA